MKFGTGTQQQVGTQWQSRDYEASASNEEATHSIYMT